jgi:glycosyltransferase 2 family protein
MSPRSIQRVAAGLLGLLASSVFAWLALRHLDVASLVATWRGARPMPWVLLAVGCYVAGHLVRGQRLRILVQLEATVPLATASNIVVVGYASNNVLPARLGEFVRAGMLAERTGIPLAQSLTVTLIERLLDGITILVLLVASAIAIDQRGGWVWEAARVGGLVFGGAVTVLAAAIFLPHAFLSMASRMTTSLSPRWRDRALALATSVIHGGACLRRPRDASRVALCSLIVWLLESAMFACILPVFALPLRLAPAAVAMSITNLGILLPSTPGYIGPFHYFCSQALIAQGVPPATALSYAVLVHLSFFLPVTLWGAGAVLWYGVQVGATAAAARAARAAPEREVLGGVGVHVIARLASSRSPGRVTPFDLALTEALVTPRGGADRAHVAEAAAFVAQEIDALPARLRALVAVGMLAFRLFVRVRYGRAFRSLDLVRRRAAVHAWAFGRIAPLRQLFRPLRSTALLAYWERATEYPARSRSGVTLPIAVDPNAKGAHG